MLYQGDDHLQAEPGVLPILLLVPCLKSRGEGDLTGECTPFKPSFRFLRVELIIMGPEAILTPRTGFLLIIVIVHGIFRIQQDKGATLYARAIVALAAVGADGAGVSVLVVLCPKQCAAVGAYDCGLI